MCIRDSPCNTQSFCNLQSDSHIQSPSLHGWDASLTCMIPFSINTYTKSMLLINLFYDLACAFQIMYFTASYYCLLISRSSLFLVWRNLWQADCFSGVTYFHLFVKHILNVFTMYLFISYQFTSLPTFSKKIPYILFHSSHILLLVGNNCALLLEMITGTLFVE